MISFLFTALSSAASTRPRPPGATGGALGVAGGSCGQVRNDGNFWEQVSSYLEKRSGLQFTHAICPPCREKESSRIKDPSSRHP